MKPVCVVTGGGAGIGLAIAHAFAESGYRVALLDLDRVALDRAVDQFSNPGGEVADFHVDITDGPGLETTFDNVAQIWGQIDVLVNNAGVARVGSVTETSPTDWSLVVDVNLTGVFLCSRAAIPIMIDTGGGAIVNIASVAAFSGAPGMAAYSASKAGVVNLSQQMAQDYGPSGIRVNCVCPGTVPTDMHSVFYDESERDEVLESWAQNKPLRRNGTTNDIANAVLFLASKEAAFITGAVLPVDGGATL